MSTNFTDDLVDKLAELRARVITDNEVLNYIFKNYRIAHFTQGLLDIGGLLLAMKLILDVEAKGLRFKPEYPNDLIPETDKFIYDPKSTELKDFTDTVVYTIILETAANTGGDKEEHGSPAVQKPIPTINFLHPKLEGVVVERSEMPLDVTIQFDFFSRTHSGLRTLTGWWRRTFFKYRDFLKNLGCGEFIWRRRFKDKVLVEKYSRYAIPNTSMQYFFRYVDLYFDEEKNIQEIILTINKETGLKLKRSLDGG